jgi:hypothetical protein
LRNEEAANLKTPNRAKVTALEGKLSKAREVKAGMMSVLLTGMVRLV